MPFIMTVKMESYLICYRIVHMISIKMVNFDSISIFEMQLAPPTFSLLLVKQLSETGFGQWMRF